MAQKRNHQPPEADERELFRREMHDVQPLGSPVRHKPEPATPSPRPRMTELDVAAVMAELLDPPLDPASLETGEELSYRHPGVQDSVLRKLKRGQYSVQAEVDLHGLNTIAAKTEVVRFLQEAQRRNWRCVRIIHGKGHRSGQQGPVLKVKVAHWLTQRQDVLAYASARPVDGGSGALYVLLRAN
ncbi:MAG: Smr/MutS family protein [Nevskiales bacterium]